MNKLAQIMVAVQDHPEEYLAGMEKAADLRATLADAEVRLWLRNSNLCCTRDPEMNKLAEAMLQLQDNPVEYLEGQEKTSGAAGLGVGGGLGAIQGILKSYLKARSWGDSALHDLVPQLIGGSLHGATAGHGLQEAIRGSLGARIGAGVGSAAGIGGVLQEALSKSPGYYSYRTQMRLPPSIAAGVAASDIPLHAGVGAVWGDALQAIIQALRGR
jgi:hypothetical protein